jgi:hypothetical protein
LGGSLKANLKATVLMRVPLELAADMHVLEREVFSLSLARA